MPALWEFVCRRTVFTFAIMSGGLVIVLVDSTRPHSQATVWRPQWWFCAQHAIPGIWHQQNGHVRALFMAVIEANLPAGIPG